ncbi:hypothetical protein [Halomonas llamarensis]|uniref:Uncharacterized protein n=1 Tax=Halomonas llamarensis TaxID=2945104 RepID=A0ABT0SV32_9GAMM|nr:hypothetical protein [Halomonas llamarensis]MCL7931652.1 hypothetical protein [Halomonas llamarensis]
MLSTETIEKARALIDKAIAEGQSAEEFKNAFAELMGNQAAHEKGKESVIDEEHQLRIQVAEAAIQGMKAAVVNGELPEDINELVILEALLLTMQMLGGPQATATVIRYSFDIFAAK